jgi:hypothetical protein
MITKRQVIELIQHRLSGGDTPEDMRKLYPKSIIARVINLALADAVTRDPYAANDMSINYVFTPSTDASGHYITLNPRPISGTLSIFTVEDESTNDPTYFIQTKLEAQALSVLRGSNKNAAILFGDKIRFNKKPTGDVTVSMIPNVYQMADDDALIVPNAEMALFTMCLQVLASPQFQDELNNSVQDAPPQPRQ